MAQGGRFRAFVHETIALSGMFAACVTTGACGEQHSERVARSEQGLSAQIFASEPTALEEPLYNETPSGWFAIASAGGSHLIVTQSHTTRPGGYGPRAFVVRDGSVVNPRGVDLSPRFRSITTPTRRFAVHTGAYWLYLHNTDLSVLNVDGSLKVKTALPFEARTMAWGANRALVMGTKQGQFFDTQGAPLGSPFDIAPLQTLRNGGMAFNGSHFLIEYSTVEGVFAVAVSPTGTVGSPITLDDYAVEPSDYGHGHSVLSDGRTFLVVYETLANDWLVRYRTASVDASLGVTLGPEQTASNFASGNTNAVFLGDRYVLSDVYRSTILHIKPDGTLQRPPSTWSPWAGAVDFEISAAPDGTSAIVVDFLGRVSRITSDLALLDNPRLQVGLGPNRQEWPSTVFDGSAFWVTWNDQARNSIRGVKVGTDGSILDPGPTQLRAPGVVRPEPLISNGSSVLRVFLANLNATLMNPNGSTVSVDLSALAGTSGFLPGLATNGEDYLVVDSVGASGRAALISPAGVVTRTLAFNGGGNSPTATFDGEKYLVAFSSYSGPVPPVPGGRSVLTITPISTDLTAGAPKQIISFPATSTAWQTIVSNGTQALVVWVTTDDDSIPRYDVYCARVSRELELLDDPPVFLGRSAYNGAPAVAWDGTHYWLSWPDSDVSLPWPDSDTYFPALRLVNPEPVRGSIVLDSDPLTLENDAVGHIALAARPGGPVLLTISGEMSSRVLRARELKPGVMVLQNQDQLAVLKRRAPTASYLDNR